MKGINETNSTGFVGKALILNKKKEFCPYYVGFGAKPTYPFIRLGQKSLIVDSLLSYHT